MVVGPRLQQRCWSTAVGPSPDYAAAVSPAGSGGSRTATLKAKRSSRPKVGEMAKPQTLLGVPSVDNGRIFRPVASTSEDNRLNTAETGGEWAAAACLMQWSGSCLF
jgi:hypothetical protein